MLFINALACKLWDHRLQQADRQVGDRKLSVAGCSRCGWQTVTSANEGEEEAGLPPEPAYESGQALVTDLLVLAPIAIALAIAVFVLTTPSTDAAEFGRQGWAAVMGTPAPF